MSFLGNLLPANNVSIPTPYQLPGQGQAAHGALSGAEGLGQYNLGGQNYGQYAGLTQAGVNNPYAALYQQGAGGAGGMMQNAGVGAFGAGGQLLGTASGELPDVNALLAMGFDPQNALYARTQQQVADQAAAQASASGVGGTPYGQGLANQANSNFNIDWQNNQLNRAVTGAQGASGLMGQIGGSFGQGAGLQQGGAQEYLQGAGQPYQTYAGINQNQLGLLGQAAGYGQQAAAIPQMQIGDYMSYLQQANQNQQTGINAQNLNLQKQNAVFNEANTLGQDFGQAIGGLAGIPSFGGGGGNQYMPNPYYNMGQAFGGGLNGMQLGQYFGMTPGAGGGFTGGY
jgi:hypothetical protein